MILDCNIHTDTEKANEYLASLIKNRSLIELKKINPKRTINQNSYLHSCFGLMAKYTGFTIEEIKVIAKREFGSFMVYEKEGSKFLRSSTELDSKQFTQWTDWVRVYGREQVGVEIPTPQQYKENLGAIMKEIDGVI